MQQDILPLKRAVGNRVERALGRKVQVLDRGGQDDVRIAVLAEIILVRVAADDHAGTVRFLRGREHAVAGVARRDEDDVAALGDQLVADGLAGRLVGERADVVAADVVAGGIRAGLAGQFDAFDGFALRLVDVFHAALKTVLIVDIRRVRDAIDDRDLIRLRLHRSCDAGEETAFLFGERHRVDVVHLNRRAIRVGRIGVDQDEVLIGILLGQRADAGKLVAAAHEHIVVRDDVGHGLDGRSGVAGRLLDRRDGAVGMLVDEV